jgi:hypothetical protein
MIRAGTDLCHEKTDTSVRLNIVYQEAAGNYVSFVLKEDNW